MGGSTATMSPADPTGGVNAFTPITQQNATQVGQNAQSQLAQGNPMPAVNMPLETIFGMGGTNASGSPVYDLMGAGSSSISNPFQGSTSGFGMQNPTGVTPAVNQPSTAPTGANSTSQFQGSGKPGMTQQAPNPAGMPFGGIL